MDIKLVKCMHQHWLLLDNNVFLSKQYAYIHTFLLAMPHLKNLADECICWYCVCVCVCVRQVSAYNIDKPSNLRPQIWLLCDVIFNISLFNIYYRNIFWSEII